MHLAIDPPSRYVVDKRQTGPGRQAKGKLYTTYVRSHNNNAANDDDNATLAHSPLFPRTWR